MDSEYISKKEIYDCLDKLESITGTSREWEDRDQVVVSTVKAVVKAVRALVGLAKEQDVVPVVHGEWNKLSGVYYACTACHRLTEVEKTMGNIIYNYCPHCGADMRQQEET